MLSTLEYKNKAIYFMIRFTYIWNPTWTINSALHEECDDFDKELNSVLIELGAVSIYKPLHEAGIWKLAGKAKILWDLSDQDLVEIGLNKGSPLTYKKARKESMDITGNKKGDKLLY